MTLLIYPITALVIFLLAKFVPLKLPVNHSEIDFPALKNKYQKWDMLSLILILILIPLMTYLIGLLFSTIFYSPENSESQVLYHIGTSRLMWYMPALVLAFGFVKLPMTFIYKVILKENFDEFILYSDLKTGADGMKIFNYMMWISGIGAIVLMMLLSDYSVNIYKEKIVLNDFLTFTDKTYSFSEIKSINYIQPLNPNTGEPQTPSYFIKFNDDGHWDTSRGLEDDNNRQEEIINYLAEKTKLKVNVLSSNPE